MQRQKLIPGREYVVDSYRVPHNRARLKSIGERRHIFEYARARGDGVSELQEVTLGSREVKREWTETDDRKQAARERTREIERAIEAGLARVYSDLPEQVDMGWGARAHLSDAIDVRVGSRVETSEDGEYTTEFFPRLTIQGRAHVERVLEALGAQQELLTEVGLESGRKLLDSGSE